jgi:hypothetical protein
MGGLPNGSRTGSKPDFRSRGRIPPDPHRERLMRRAELLRAAAARIYPAPAPHDPPKCEKCPGLLHLDVLKFVS